MTTLPIPLTTPVSLDAAVLDAARRAMSENSWRALRADLRVFGQWADARGLAVLPALPATIAGFLRNQAEAGKKAATLARYTASIARLHALGRKPHLVGVAFDCQQVERVPDEPHDVMLAEMLTESGLRSFAPAV